MNQGNEDTDETYYSDKELLANQELKANAFVRQ